jgi:hypothetical protein
MIEWFIINSLALSVDTKIPYNLWQMIPPACILIIGSIRKYTEESVKVKILCLQIYKNLTWTYHTNKMIPKLRAAGFALGSLCQISITDTHTHTHTHTQFI